VFYEYSIVPPAGYVSSPSSGSIMVHFASVNQVVTFTPATSELPPVGDIAVILAIILVVAVVLGLIFFRTKPSPNYRHAF
jgi:hypothetical protein